MADEITRREAVAGMAAAGASLGLLGRSEAQRRPNVVFILIDDMDVNAMSCMNHPFMKTPHMDRLAREGLRFENAFVNISLCSPSRACFLTGCEPQRTACPTNEGEEYDHRVPTFPLVLQQNGYDTAYVGKWHMANAADPRPGFNYWLSFRGQGVYTDPPLNENGREFKATGYMTDLLTQYAVDWLKRERSQPFCLYLSHKAVHGPFTPPERYQGALADAVVPEPPNYRDDFHDKPWWIRANMVRGSRREQWRKNADKPVPDAIPPVEWQGGKNQLNYYRTLMGVDDSVGTVLDTLQELGVLDDTLVIFTSDNGYFHGEHRRGDKRLAYEESMRIPMLVRYPRLVKAGTVTAPMTLNIDVCPTVLDICGAPIPEGVAGASFKPLLTSPGTKPADWRDDWLYQYFQEGWLEGLPNLQAVRTERWKYIASPDYPEDVELYDLQTDPIEMVNLAGQPETAEIQAKLAKRLAELLAAADASQLPPPPPPPGKLQLSYRFDQPGDRIQDLSANDRIGVVVNTVKQATVAGVPARVFDGAGRIDLDAKLSPPVQRLPFFVDVKLRADAPDGVALAHGGASNGYLLQLVGGKPTFILRSGGAEYQVAGKDSLVGKWAMVGVQLGPDGSLALTVDDQPAGSSQHAMPVQSLPNDGLNLGADAGSPVADEHLKPFRGAIAELKIGTGLRDDALKSAPPEPPPAAPVAGLLLDYDLAQPGAVAKDLSGQQRDGKVTGAKPETVDGKAARVFSVGSRIEVTPELSPPIQGQPFRVEAIVRPTAADGVMVSQGGQTNGWSLELQGGKLLFVVNSSNRQKVATGTSDLTGAWHTVTGKLAADGTLSVSVDGQTEVEVKGGQRLGSRPNEGLVVGADLATRVGPGEAQPFQGAMARVIVSAG